MLNKNTLQNEFDIDIAINDLMERSIELWSDMYQNNPPWKSKNVSCMGIPGAIANELARLVTIEFKSEISDNEFLNEEYKKVLKDLKTSCEYACAKGGLIFKPYVNEDHIEVDIIQMDNFFPVSYKKNEITAAIFLESKVIGKKQYTRVEYHSLEDGIYTIKNTAFEKTNIINSNTLGKQVSLSIIPEWEDLEEETTIKNMDKPLFSFFRIPLANQIDPNSPLGVSVYSKAKDLIEEADKQYSRILWEYEGTELAVNADESLFRLNPNTKLPELPEGKERLYRTFDFENVKLESQQMLETFSPNIRDSSLFNGLNQLLRRIEFNCGLAYGTLSDINDTDKTATEIKASKQRSYSTVKDIQKALQIALMDLVECMYILSKLYNLQTGNFNKENISFDWDDSIILDKDSELAAMREDVAAGILKPEIYLAKKYGVSEEEAKKLMPNIEDSIKTKSPYDDLEE